jgi:hypothetical protein
VGVPKSNFFVSDGSFADTWIGTAAKNYLKTYINGARQRGAIPILVTPVGRCDFNTTTGKFNLSFPGYVQGMKEVAAEMNVMWWT